MSTKLSNLFLAFAVILTIVTYELYWNFGLTSIFGEAYRWLMSPFVPYQGVVVGPDEVLLVEEHFALGAIAVSVLMLAICAYSEIRRIVNHGRSLHAARVLSLSFAALMANIQLFWWQL